MNKIIGASMFSSAGIAETYFSKSNIDIVVANELIEKRAEFYSQTYPSTKMIVGDINDKSIREHFINCIPENAKFLIATPPCQGLSTLGMNKTQDQMSLDVRNFLVFNILEVIDRKDFDYILIENVPRFLDMYFPYNSGFYKLEEILNDKYSKTYNVEIRILNAKDYGVPQLRPRAIIKIFKKEVNWSWPIKEKEITVFQSIGHLPSLEAGQTSNLKFHTAKPHNERDILCMRNTPTGYSAFQNVVFYPKRKDGIKVSGFHNTYKRMKWDSPAPARTMNNGNIGSHNNVHPGRRNEDGTYSDARVLTLRELFIISSLPEEWNYPSWCSDSFIRHIIGEAIPPLLAYKIVESIGR